MPDLTLTLAHLTPADAPAYTEDADARDAADLEAVSWILDEERIA